MAMRPLPGAHPKIRDVAARARVSPGTVSNVLTGRRRVDAALARRVRDAVKELGYVRHAAASQLRSRRTTVIGAVVPDLPDSFCATFVGRVEELARADGYRTLVAGSGEDPDEELAQVQALAAWRPAGVLIIPTDDRFRGGQFLAAAGIPVVAVDRVRDGMPVDAIGIDNAAEAGRAAAHLAELGHKRVLVVASSLALHNICERAAGARAALEGRATVEVVGGGESEMHAAALTEVVLKRLGRRPLPTAVLALTNQATLGAVQALQRRGLVIPRDVSLVGFDDNEWMQVMLPGISAVRQPVEALASKAWARLVARMHGDAAPPVHLRLSGSLEMRNSSGAPAELSGGGGPPPPPGRRPPRGALRGGMRSRGRPGRSGMRLQRSGRLGYYS